MDPWDLHYLVIDFKDILGYINCYGTNSMKNVPKLDGDPSSIVDHLVKFIKYALEINMVIKDALKRFFINFLGKDPSEWVKYSCEPKSIPSVKVFIEKILE